MSNVKEYRTQKKPEEEKVAKHQGIGMLPNKNKPKSHRQ